MSSNQNNYSDPTLTEQDIKLFEAKKANYFKGSIAVAVVYGIVALGLILLAALSDAGRTMIFENLKPFVITLAVGIIVVITVMVLQLMSIKPIKVGTVMYDASVCPDYWQLEETPLNELNSMSEEERLYAQTRCRRNTKITDNNNTTTVMYTSPASDDQSDAAKLNRTVRNYLDSTNIHKDGQMNCNMLYPVSLGLKDETSFPAQQNKARCDIAQKCGFAWSGVC